MTRWLLTLMAVVAAGAGALGADVPAAILDPYFRIQSGLAADQIDTIKTDSAALAAAAAQAGSDAKSLEGAARALEGAPNLKAARDAFGKLSDALIQYAQHMKTPLGRDVVTVYCPMVRKSWAQRGRSIRNPYYGKQMLECGEMKK